MFRKSVLFLKITIFCLFLAAAQTSSASKEYMIHHTLKLGNGQIYQALFSPDNRFIVTLAKNHSLHLFSSDSGKRLKTISTGEHRAVSVISHPQDPLLITGGKDHTIRLWNVNRGQSDQVLRGHIGAVTALAINRRGNLLISGSADGSLAIWDLNTLTLRQEVKEAHAGVIRSIDLHPNGQFLATGGKDRATKIWNFDNMQLLYQLNEHSGNVNQVRFHPEGSLLATISSDPHIHLWRWQQEIVYRSFTRHKKEVTGIDFHRNGRHFISASKEGTIYLWDIESGNVLESLPFVDNAVGGVAFDSSGKRVIGAFEKNFVHTWQLGSSALLASWKAHKRNINSLTFTNNGRYLISNSLDKKIRIWDIEKREAIKEYAIFNDRLQDLALYQDDQRFLTGGASSVISVWDTQTGEQLYHLRGHEGKVNSIDVHPTEKILLSGSTDQQWRVWDIETRQPTASKPAHKDQITSVKFDREGKWFATGSNDKVVRIWKYPGGGLLDNLRAHKKRITSLDFHPRLDRLVSSSGDGMIHLWKLDSKGKAKRYASLEGHRFIVNHVLFSKDGKTVISTSKDKTVRLWDAEHGGFIQVLSGEQAPITALALSQDGKLIAVGTVDGQITLIGYPLTIAELPDANDNSEPTPPPVAENTELVPTARTDIPVPLPPLYEEEIDDDDMASLEESQVEEDIYTILQVDDYQGRRLRLQQELNDLMKKGGFCTSHERLQEVALELQTLAPYDLAVYHALLKVSTIKRDIPFLFLLVKISEFAQFIPEIYNYAPMIDIRNEFSYWSQEVFDLSHERRGTALELSIQGCDQEQYPISLPTTIKTMDMPKEFLRNSAFVPNLINLQDFQKLKIFEFQNRIFHEISEGLVPPKARLRESPPRSEEYRAPAITTGWLELDLVELQLWGSPARIPFHLREGGGAWQTFLADLDKRKQLLLPAGNYYLRIGNRIKRAFVLGDSQNLQMKISNHPTR